MSCIDVNGEIHDRAKKNRHGQVRRVFEGIKNVKDTLEKIQRMRMKGGEGRESERERERGRQAFGQKYYVNGGRLGC
jgi:hypothetical protein